MVLLPAVFLEGDTATAILFSATTGTACPPLKVSMRGAGVAIECMLGIEMSNV